MTARFFFFPFKLLGSASLSVSSLASERGREGERGRKREGGQGGGREAWEVE